MKSTPRTTPYSAAAFFERFWAFVFEAGGGDWARFLFLVLLLVDGCESISTPATASVGDSSGAGSR